MLSPSAFFGKLAGINARQLACTSAHQPYGGWGGGGGLRTGSLWDGRGDGSRGSRNGWKCGWTDFVCGGCGYEAGTLGVERVVAGKRGLTMLSGRIRAEIRGRLCYHPSVYRWLCLQI